MQLLRVCTVILATSLWAKDSGQVAKPLGYRSLWAVQICAGTCLSGRGWGWGGKDRGGKSEDNEGTGKVPTFDKLESYWSGQRAS